MLSKLNSPREPTVSEAVRVYTVRASKAALSFQLLGGSTVVL